MSSFSLPWHDFRTKIIISLWKVYSFRGLHAFKAAEAAFRTIHSILSHFLFISQSFSILVQLFHPWPGEQLVSRNFQRWRFKTIVEFYSTTLAHTENNDWKVFFFFFSSDERRKLREFWPVCLCRSKIRAGRADNWKRITSALLYRVPVIKLSFAPSEFPVRHFYESRAIKEPWLISWTSTDQRGKVNIVAAR